MERFLGALAPDDPRVTAEAIGIVGIPYDGAVTYRAGASAGPQAIRDASDSIETYCPKLGRDLEDLTIVDYGDLELSPGTPRGIMDACRARLEGLAAGRFLVFGGDHLVAWAPLSRAVSQYPDLQVFHVDAHTDLRDHWEGEAFNHSTVLGRVVDVMTEPQKLWSWGIRSGLRSEFERARNDSRIELVNNDLAAGTACAQKLAASRRPVYLTIDVDGIDPAEIPGTGTPEPDGLRFGWVEAAIAELGRGRLVGADIVELAPAFDPSGRSQVAVARLARSVLLAMGRL